MIEPGETFDGYDERGHLFVVISQTTATVSGEVALTNLTSHYSDRARHDATRVTIHSDEHPWVRRDSCVYYERVELVNPSSIDRGVHDGEFQVHPPLSPQLLRRVQLGALASPLVSDEVKDAIRASLDERS